MTEIALSDGALVGAGVGIRTFLFALAESRRTWYSVAVDPDNDVFLTLVEGVDDGRTTAGPPLLPASLQKQFGIEESPLSDALREKLAIDLAPDRAFVGRPELAEHVIELHDDCLFRFETNKDTGFEQVLGGILAMHEEYLDREGLQAAAPQVLQLLRSQSKLRLKSEPARERVRLLGRAQGGVARWLPRWTTVGAVERSGPAWRVVRRGA